MNMAVLTSIPVHLLVVIFGTGSWMTLNGVFVESPILTQELPEGWALVTYITVISQLANVGPLLFGLLKHYKPGYEKVAIHGVMVIGITASFVAILVWKKTIFVGSTERSVPLLILVFLMALVGCTAVVSFPLFIASFKKTYLISLVLGEGMSGLIPGLLAIAQGTQSNECQNITINETEHKIVQVTTDPRFSTTVFFAILFIMMVASEVSFILLNTLSAVRKEMITQNENGLPATENSPFSPTAVCNNKESPTVSLNTRTIAYLLIQQALIAGLSNTALPSIQSYACIPYGLFVYHLSVTLSSIANPLGTFASFFYKCGEKTVYFLTVLVIAISCYIITMAAYSPTPPLGQTVVGQVLMITSWVLIMGGGAYAKVSIANIIRKQGKPNHLFMWGLATQLGSFVGALVMFVLVNFVKSFHDAQPCQNAT